MFQTIRPLLIAVSLTALLGALALSPAAQAQGIKRIGDYGDWSAFQFSEDGNPACYISSEPTKATGDYQRRGDVFAIVMYDRLISRGRFADRPLNPRALPEALAEHVHGGQVFRGGDKESLG